MASIRESLESAAEELEKASVETSIEESEKEVSTEETVEEPSSEETPIKEAASKEEPISKQPVTPSNSKVEKAPSSWKADAKVLWNNLPEQARQEIQRRETEFNRFIQESSTSRKVYDQLSSIIEPYNDIFQHNNLHPLQAISGILADANTLLRGSMEQKAELVGKIIENYGVDIETLEKAILKQRQVKADPTISTVQQLLQQEIAPIRQRIESWEQQNQQGHYRQTEEQAKNLIQDFGKTHPYLNELSDEMADLIDFEASRGNQLDLESAYNKALLLHPELNKSSLSSSVGGAPRVSTQVNSSGADLRSTIENAFNSLR